MFHQSKDIFKSEYFNKSILFNIPFFWLANFVTTSLFCHQLKYLNKFLIHAGISCLNFLLINVELVHIIVKQILTISWQYITHMFSVYYHNVL